jgi:hypothetical protein
VRRSMPLLKPSPPTSEPSLGRSVSGSKAGASAGGDVITCLRSSIASCEPRTG